MAFTELKRTAYEQCESKPEVGVQAFSYMNLVSQVLTIVENKLATV